MVHYQRRFGKNIVNYSHAKSRFCMHPVGKIKGWGKRGNTLISIYIEKIWVKNYLTDLRKSEPCHTVPAVSDSTSNLIFLTNFS